MYLSELMQTGDDPEVDGRWYPERYLEEMKIRSWRQEGKL